MVTLDAEYVDDGALRGQDRVPLEDFLAFRDRAQLTGRGQPFFSGRESEVNAFREVANALLRGHRGNATLIVEGPPGAGKSALLAQFQEEMRAFPSTAGGSRRWLPVTLDGALAMSPLEIMAAVDEAIARRLAQDLVGRDGDGAEHSVRQLAALLGRKALDNAQSVAQGILDRGVSAMGLSIGPRGEAPPSTLPQAVRLRGRDWADWQIVLLIDEAQGISCSVPGASPGTLSSIHQGMVSAPLSFCAFGLPGTSSALSDVGISRPSGGRHLPLHGLDGSAARMAVRRCFGQYGVVHGEDWESAILDRSANWPQHLATYLHAALSVLKKGATAREAMGDVRRSPLAEALALGDVGRNHYYERQIRRLNRHNARHARYAKALVPLFRENDGALPLDLAIEGLEGGPLHLSEEAVNRFLTDAAHSGFLAHERDGRLCLPIPSFANHLLGERAPPP
ncbi:MAG: hypothetical protein OXG51_15460 [Gammaproteobacteria bacterium]|nr:hypothetical protein [Gammaproteobacteria bacterium]